MTPVRPSRRIAVVAGTLLLLAAALVDISVVRPPVNVRWRDDVSASQRRVLEERYGLERGEAIEGQTWRYELRDASSEHVAALVRDPRVVDTQHIDRETFSAPSAETRIGLRRVRALLGPQPGGLVQPQSVVLFGAGALLLWAAGRPDRRRRAIALAALSTVAVAAFVLPLRQPIRMGDSDTYVQSREAFEDYTGVRQIRFEAHLSHAILGRLDRLFGRTPDSPARALQSLMQIATVWFIAMTLLAGFVERWSPVVVRYLALVVLAPATLLYFGYVELGHLSLNAAVFPLLVRGLREGTAPGGAAPAGGSRAPHPPHTRYLEASGLLAGLGAALHGFGLLSMAGSALAAMGRAFDGSVAAAARMTLRVVAWSVAAYLGWVAIYLIVLKLPVLPGHADAIPLRPWLTDVAGDRVNAAILSARGARDVIATVLVVGMPLVLLAASLWRRVPFETRAAMLYALPAIVFAIVLWPIQGLAVEMDLVFAAFPAVYAVAWVCAQDRRHAVAAALMLAAAHLVFWRVVLDSAFVNSRV